MALPSSGQITSSMINVELGRAANAPFSLTGAAERALAGIPSGPISFQSFWGKSSYTPIAAQIVNPTVNRLFGVYTNPDGSRTACVYDGTDSWLVRFQAPSAAGFVTILSTLKLTPGTAGLNIFCDFGLTGAHIIGDNVFLSFASHMSGRAIFVRWDLSANPVYIKSFASAVSSLSGVSKSVLMPDGNIMMFGEAASNYTWQLMNPATGAPASGTNTYRLQTITGTNGSGLSTELSDVLFNPVTGNPVFCAVCVGTSGAILTIFELNAAGTSLIRSGHFNIAVTGYNTFSNTGVAMAINGVGEVILAYVNSRTNAGSQMTINVLQFTPDATNSYTQIPLPTYYQINLANLYNGTDTVNIINKSLRIDSGTFIFNVNFAKTTAPTTAKAYFIKFAIPSGYNISTVQSTAILEVAADATGTSDLTEMGRFNQNLPCNESHFCATFGKRQYMELPYNLESFTSRSLNYVAGNANVSLTKKTVGNMFTPHFGQPGSALSFSKISMSSGAAPYANSNLSYTPTVGAAWSGNLMYSQPNA